MSDKKDINDYLKKAYRKKGRKEHIQSENDKKESKNDEKYSKILEKENSNETFIQSTLKF